MNADVVASPTGGGADEDAGAVVSMGTAIRRRRLEQGLSLRQLGELAELSPGFLSLAERGRSSFGIASAERVASALGTTVAELWGSEGDRSAGVGTLPYVARAEAVGNVTVATRGRTYVLLSPRSPNPVLEPILLFVEPTEVVDEPYGHRGEQFVYVLSGQLLCRFADREDRLDPGDSIHIAAGVSHSIVNDRQEQARAVVVLTERFF